MPLVFKTLFNKTFKATVNTEFTPVILVTQVNKYFTNINSCDCWMLYKDDLFM